MRRLLHAASTTVALLALVSPGALRIGTAYLAITAVIVEVLRLRVPAVGHALSTVFPVYREREHSRPSGAMWLAIGYALASWMPPGAAVAGIASGGLADPAGAVVGTRFGHGAGKSLAGSIAVAVTTVIVVGAAGAPWPAAAGAAAVATLVERWPGPLDDNLLVSPAVGVAVMLLA